jgi:hypothetical protein
MHFLKIKMRNHFLHQFFIFSAAFYFMNLNLFYSMSLLHLIFISQLLIRKHILVMLFDRNQISWQIIA